MEKTEEFHSAHASEPAPSVHSSGSSRSGRRRRSRSREEMHVQLKLLRLQRCTLGISTGILLLACFGLAFWALHAQSLLADLTYAPDRPDAQIERVIDELTAARAELEESRWAIETLVADRIPGLSPFRVDEPLSVDTPFVRHVTFKSASIGHECKLVIENDSDSVIQPTLSVVLFDDFGIEVTRAKLVDGERDALRADEIRSYFANLETKAGEVPRYFRITSD